MVQFSFYVNANSEALRSRFVTHRNKKNLKVSIQDHIRAIKYDDFIKTMTNKVLDNLVLENVNWILPNFTTTTPEDTVINGAILMATMQNYFEYEASVLCGIPEMTLLGSLDDWREIKRR